MQFQPDATDLNKELMEMLGHSNTPIKTTDNKTKSSKDEFSEQSAAFWAFKGKPFSASYEKGQLMSNFNSVSKYEYEGLLLSISRLLEETIRTELNNKGLTLDEIKNILKAIEELFKILSTSLNSKFKPEQLPATTLIAGLHGLINSYAEKT